MTHAETVEKVRRQLARYRHGETGAVLEPGLVEAAWDAVGHAPGDLDIRELVGQLHFARFCVIEDEACRRELALSAQVLEPVFAARPDRVPPLVRDMLIARDARGGPSPLGDKDAKALRVVGMGLLYLVQETGDPAALEAAVATLRRAAELAPDTGRLRVACLNTLAVALRRAWRSGGGLPLLREAAEMCKAAVAAHDGDAADRAGLLNNASNALRDLAGETGDDAALTEAVAASREAVRLAPRRAMFHNGLSLALRALWRVTGDTDALAESVAAARLAAVDLLPEGHPDRAVYLNALSQALQQSAQVNDDEAALAEAVAASRRAVASTPAGHPDLAPHLDNLSSVLHLWWERTGDRSMLPEAVAIGERAVLAAGKNTPESWAYSSNLASVLLAVWRAHAGDAGDTKGIDVVVARSREAVEHLDPASPDRIVAAHALATALRARSEALGDPSDRAEAIAWFRQVALAPGARTGFQLDAAAAWGQLCAEGRDWAAAAEAFGRAVELLPRLASRGLSLADQERQLARGLALASDAAVCALHAGAADAADAALALLEQGRGVLLSRILERDGDLAEVRRHAPRLAARLDQIRQQLADAGMPRHDTAASGDLRRALAAEWERVVAEIRDVPELAGFLRPPSPAAVRAAAGAGTIAVIAVSRYGTHALLVRGSGVTPVPLPAVDPDTVVDQLAVLLAGVEAAADPERSLADLFGAQAGIDRVLRWLWHAVAGPILGTIGAIGATDAAPGADSAAAVPASRVWWCPTGVLGLLPLHAAGDAGLGEAATVHRRAVSSYVPTIRTLLAAQARPPAGRARGLLVVSVPDAPGGSHLPGAAAAGDAILDRRLDVRRLAGPSANRDEVLRALPGRPWAHFACHAVADLAHPSRSHLVLRDGPLPVSELLATRLPGAELAVLSACETARGGVALADESLHIAAAFHLAGYRHVVGGLWALSDVVAAEVVERFFAIMVAGPGAADDPRQPAQALHRAVGAVRDANPDAPSLWAPFLHVGP